MIRSLWLKGYDYADESEYSKIGFESGSSGDIGEVGSFIQKIGKTYSTRKWHEYDEPAGWNYQW